MKKEEFGYTEDVMHVVHTSVENMDASRLSEPINERAKQLRRELSDDEIIETMEAMMRLINKMEDNQKKERVWFYIFLVTFIVLEVARYYLTGLI